MPQVVLAGVVGAVAEPHLDRRRLHRGRDAAALDDGRHGLRAHLRRGMAERAEHVVLVLERVAVDGADAQAAALDVVAQRGVVVHPVPGDVEGDGPRDARVAPHRAGVVDLLLDVARARRPAATPGSGCRCSRSPTMGARSPGRPPPTGAAPSRCWSWRRWPSRPPCLRSFPGRAGQRLHARPPTASPVRVSRHPSEAPAGRRPRRVIATGRSATGGRVSRGGPCDPEARVRSRSSPSRSAAAPGRSRGPGAPGRGRRSASATARSRSRRRAACPRGTT